MRSNAAVPMRSLRSGESMSACMAWMRPRRSPGVTRIPVCWNPDVNRVKEEIADDSFLVLNILVKRWSSLVTCSFLDCFRLDVLDCLCNGIAGVLPIIAVEKIPNDMYVTNANLEGTFLNFLHV